MSRYLTPKLKNLIPYTPGEQLSDKEYIKLNTNESPYPPGPKVLAAIQSEDLERLRLYPSPTQDRLKDAIAEKYSSCLESGQLTKDNIFVSNGSDDILNFSFMAFCDEMRGVVYPDISYGFYKVFADFHGIKKIEIPLKPNFTIDPKDYKESNYREVFAELHQGSLEEYAAPGLVVFANPNAPTGLALKLKEVEEIVKSNPKSVVLVDEAYVDFGGETAISLTAKYQNVLVCRTFSKSASLAGARLGFAIGPKELIEDLELIKYSTNPYNINRMTELVGLAVLEEEDYYMANCSKIVESRQWTKDSLSKMGFSVMDSRANFIFVGAGEFAMPNTNAARIGGQDLYKKLKAKGILVRWFDKDKVSDFLRISIGTQEDMEQLVYVIKEIISY